MRFAVVHLEKDKNHRVHKSVPSLHASAEEIQDQENQTMGTRVLKSDSLAELLQAGQFNYEDLQRRCEVYLESVRQQARQMLLDAEAEVETIRQQAREAGKREGHATGLQQAENELAQRVQQQAGQLLQQRVSGVLGGLKQATAQIEQERQQVLARWEQRALQLSLAIAEKLIHQQLDAHPELLAKRVEDILQLALGGSRTVVRLPAADLERVGPQLQELLELTRHQAGVELIQDDRLSTGDCIVETDQGRIDARIETQLNRIVQELFGPTNELTS